MQRATTHRAVFVVGCPRSGTSVFYETLARHPDFACTTNLTRRFRDHLWIVRLAEAVGHRQRPVEAGEMWRSIWPRGDHLARADEATEEQRRYLRRIVDFHVRHFRRPIFLSKNPGLTTRIEWLAAVLPEARFIHLVRDGRATAASILKVCRRKKKRWSIKKSWPELRGKDFATYSGMLWSRLAVAGDRSLRTLHPSRVLTVRYEQFVAAPHETFRRAAAFAGARWNSEHDAILPEIRNHNGAWDREIGPGARRRMYEQLIPGLEYFGYDTDSEFAEGAPRHRTAAD